MLNAAQILTKLNGETSYGLSSKIVFLCLTQQYCLKSKLMTAARIHILEYYVYI